MSSQSFARIQLPGSKLDGLRGIPMDPYDLAAITWDVPTPGPGHVVVMLESLETVAVPERCLAPVNSLYKVERGRDRDP